MASRNFWNSCPRKLEYFIEVPCPLGRLGAHNTKNSSEITNRCNWFINSEEDFYCFWKWIRKVSDKDGNFKPLLQHEITTLLNCSSTKANINFKNALQNLKNTEEFEKLKEYF